MTKGKYANRSDAAKARSDALEEADRLRSAVSALRNEADKKIAAMDAANVTLRDDLSRIHALMVAGTSDALEAERAESAQLRARESAIKRGMWEAIKEVFEKWDGQMPMEGWTELATKLGQPFASEDAGGRYMRRMRAHSPKLVSEVEQVTHNLGRKRIAAQMHESTDRVVADE